MDWVVQEEFVPAVESHSGAAPPRPTWLAAGLEAFNGGVWRVRWQALIRIARHLLRSHSRARTTPETSIPSTEDPPKLRLTENVADMGDQRYPSRPCGLARDDSP